MTILITGATGNVGAATVAALCAQGEHPRVAVTDVARAQHLFGDRATPVPFDFTRPATFGAAFAGVRRLLLVRPPALANVTRDIAPALAAAEAAGIEQVVFLSLLGVERAPIVPHHRIEALLRASGMAWTFLRSSYFMQNLSTTHRAEIRDEGAIVVPAGRGKTSFIDVRDIAAVAALALTEPGHAGQAYPLTGAAALDYATVAELLTVVLGRPIRYADPAPLAYARRLARQGRPTAYILVTSALYLTARLGLAAVVTDDLARLLGREPITMRRFIEDHRQVWCRSTVGGAATRDTTRADIDGAEQEALMAETPVTHTPEPAAPVEEAVKPPLPRWAYRIVNPIMATILRSPLHRLLSDALLLLSFRGHKSGKPYTIPVGYLQEGDRLHIFCHAGWWRNLPDQPVTVRLRGQERRGTARRMEERREIAALVRRVLARRGDAMARRMGLLEYADPEATGPLPQRTKFFEITLDPQAD